jgi:hypothetical protein
MYRAGEVTLAQALRYSRQNTEGTGTQNLNYKYHMQVIEKARAAAGCARESQAMTLSSVG